MVLYALANKSLEIRGKKLEGYSFVTRDNESSRERCRTNDNMNGRQDQGKLSTFPPKVLALFHVANSK